MARHAFFCSIMEVLLSLTLFATLFVPLYCYNIKDENHSLDAIYQFGDSISDTGNSILSDPQSGCGKPPYGQTYFHHPTGRCSDGLLMIDYFCQFFNLPLLSPYLDKQGDFTHGVNFAVAGATALNISTLAGKNITGGVPGSLLVQLDWFRSHLNTICANPSDCKQNLGKALFLVGEIGGNDYNAGAFEGKSTEELRNLVPDVVQTIMDVVTAVIDLGAKRIVVPGNFPVGCMTIYLAAFRSNDTTMYDELQCLKNWNDLAAFHNDQLQNAIRNLQQQHSDVVIVYGDYYNALRSLFQEGPSLGFDKDALHKACCGLGDNNYNFGARYCGGQGVPVCPDPNLRVSWDGVHLTEHAYQIMAQSLLKNIAPAVA